MFYVYVLLSIKDKNIYTGLTSNLLARLTEHKEGLVRSTRSRRPVKLIYYEAYLSKVDALRREKYLKLGGKAKTTLKKQIQESLLF
ncbi:MAG: GIY-YIG nuclease family protein [Candidatus Shapirobacteria bacterium]